MKKLALILLSISCIVFSCTNDEKMPVKGNVQFAVAVSAKTSDGGRIAADVLPDGAYVSLSIETSSGVSVYSFKKIDLLKLGDSYVTAPLALIEGWYHLTDFMILSKENVVLYATPKEGSPLAPLVNNPLPINFSITKDGIVNLDVQVVSAAQQAPPDFGYASFSIDVMHSDFSVSLFTSYDNNTLNLTSGTLTLYHNNEVVYTQELQARVNPINFKGDSAETYTLFVQGRGYTVRSKEYVLRDLLNELDGKPLTFILEPALNMTTVHHAVFDNNLPFSYNMGVLGSPNSPYKYTVDWGDGTIENVEGITDATGFKSLFILHFYTDSLIGRPSYMNITGDIGEINFFFFVNPLPLSVKSIDISQLTNLDSFAWIVVTDKGDTPFAMDISGLRKLKTFFVSRTNLQYLEIASNPLLYRLDVSGTNISNDNLNAIIFDLYDHAVHNSLENGIFGYDNVQQLTPESVTKLRNLRDHGWQIIPDPQ